MSSFSVLLGRVQVAPGGDELRPRRSLEVRGSPRLQNGSLRALEEAWNDFSRPSFDERVVRLLGPPSVAESR